MSVTPQALRRVWQLSGVQSQRRAEGDDSVSHDSVHHLVLQALRLAAVGSTVAETRRECMAVFLPTPFFTLRCRRRDWQRSDVQKERRAEGRMPMPAFLLCVAGVESGRLPGVQKETCAQGGRQCFHGRHSFYVSGSAGEKSLEFSHADDFGM